MGILSSKEKRNIEKMKVKILSRMGEDNPEVFENQINAFIKDKEVIDIKYQTALAIAANDQMGSTGEFDENVLIMYEEKTND